MRTSVWSAALIAILTALPVATAAAQDRRREGDSTGRSGPGRIPRDARARRSHNNIKGWIIFRLLEVHLDRARERDHAGPTKWDG